MRNSFMVVLIFLLTTPATLLWGQGAIGSIVGNVTDTSGAVIPGAVVTVTNTQTNVSRSTKSSAQGSYTVPYLTPGLYQVTVESKGFTKFTAKDIRLAVDQSVRVDAQLKLGAVTQTLTVSGQTVAINTENSTVGQVITGKQTEDLPLNGRNFTDLLLLGPGAVQTSGEQGTRPNAGDAISIMGGRASSNQFLIDGVTDNDTEYQTPAILPSIDAIQEFKEQTRTYSAAYGSSANQINISIKSGTNQLHGTAFEFLRNDALDARSFFDNAIPPLRQNQFGFTLGGPVYLPKVYNGRNRTFFFANYEGFRHQSSATSFGVVPTTTELQGQFSTPITNPATGQPFPGDAIPASDISQFAKVVTPLIPAPNVNLPQGNVELLIPLPTRYDQQTYRVDEDLGPKDRVFGRFSSYNYTDTVQAGLTPIADILDDLRNWSYEASYTHIFSPTVVNQFRWGYLNARANRVGAPAPAGSLNALGLTGLYQGLKNISFPIVSFSNSNLSSAGGAVNVPWFNDQPTYDINDSITMMKGDHSLEFGVELRRWQMLNNTTTGFFGQWTFDGSYTGNPLADFLLGDVEEVWATQPTAFSNPANPGAPVDVHYSSFAPFFEDDWNVNRRLTLNIGLRYDYAALPYEEHNHWSWFDPTIPGGGIDVADKSLITKGLGGAYYRYGGGRTAGKSQKKVFAPRFGFAYRPFGGTKTVVRGGYGVFFDTAEAFEDIGSGNIYPYTIRATYYGVPGTSPLNTADLFPNLATPGPVQQTDLSFYEPQASQKFDPYVQQWSLTVERQLSSNTTLDLSYNGSKGTHLNMRGNPNQPYPDDPANPTTALERTPFPNMGLIVESFWQANSNYNALNVKFQRRTHGLDLLAAYTWARSMDDKSAAAANGASAAGWAGPMNFHNWRLDYGPSSYDVADRFIAGFVYPLPVGRGERWFSTLSKPANLALGGWQVNGIVNFQSGFPYSVYATDLNFLNHAYGQRADAVGDPYPSGFKKSVQEWLNTSAFRQPALGLYGNAGRNSMRGPGINDFDLSLFKNFAFTERLKAQLRLESFNAFNHTQFNDPDHSVADGPQFGVIGSAKPGRINQLALKLIW